MDGQPNTSTGIDQWGFDSTGVHQVTGQPYDQYGFDQAGNHVVTGYAHNPDGCSRDYVDEAGNYCEPALYVDPAAQNFIDSISAELPRLVERALERLRADTTATLTSRQAQCDATRITMDALVAELGFDSTFVYGSEGQFFGRGMSDHFISEPQPYRSPSGDRDPKVEELERQHIQLYHCDVRELRIRDHLELLLAAVPGEVADEVAVALTYQSAGVIASFGNPDTFSAWLRTTIEGITVRDSEEGGFSSWAGTPRSDLYAPPAAQSFRTLATLAGEVGSLGFSSLKEQRLYELNARFRQGATEIGGVHRAHFLHRLLELREETTTPTAASLLPLEIKKYIGGMAYSIILDEVNFTTDLGPTLTAYMIIEDPESGQKLVFEASELAFGVGGVRGDSRLALASNVAIRLSNAAKLILRQEDTFVDWDCTGFTGVGVAGEVELCREMVVPLDETTLEPLPDDVPFTVAFETYATEWLDAVVRVDAGDFAIARMDGFKWSLDSLVVDLSDKVTPDFLPCTGYASRHFHEQHGLSPLWKGFYLQQLAVRLPDDFSLSGDPLAIGVENVLIDHRGVSGEAFVENVNILDIDNGSGGGWPFSIDRLNVSVLHNEFSGAGFGGQLLLPVFPDDTLTYAATLHNGSDFRFAVNGLPELRMNMLLADATLNSNTTFELLHGSAGFRASANLFGDLRINVPASELAAIRLPALHFQDLRISNRAPHFQAGDWQITDAGLSLDFGGFGLDLANIRPHGSPGGDAFGIGFDVGIGLAPAVDLYAGGSFAITGELQDNGGRHRWAYKGLDLNGLGIDATIKNILHVNGALKWFKNDADYGTGFHGILSAEFASGPMAFTTDMAGQFGRINDDRYFFVDAMLGLGQGIPVGVLNLNGFGGGVSYHMDSDLSAAAMDFTAGRSTHFGSPIGKSFSGVRYTVDTGIGLGLQATVSMNMHNDALFNGWASLGMQFNAPDHGGGLREISLKGQGQFLQVSALEAPSFVENLPIGNELLPIDDTPDIGAPLSAWVDVTYNHNEKSLDGTLESYLDLDGVMEGVGENKKLVQAQLHISRDIWFFNMGTPRDPAGMRLRAGPLLDLKSTSYFNMGTDIPDFPGLPGNVRSLTGAININESLRKSGGGLMFGAAIYARAGIDAGIVAAEVEANLGFDLMLRNYGDARCIGATRPIGVDGWYASGQAWAYLNGSVNILGARIFEAGIAGVLQAQLPNPLFARASLTAHAKLLFIRKKVSFNVEIGEQCALRGADGNPVPQAEYINFIDPADGVPYVDVDTKPEVYFAHPLDRVFVADEDEYRLEVDEIRLTSLGRGYPLPIERRTIGNGAVVRIIPDNLLPAHDSLTLTVSVRILKNGSAHATESRSVTFYTGNGYDHVPNSNIDYTYPTAGAYEFYPAESGDYRGYVQLLAGQADLFEETLARPTRWAAFDRSPLTALSFDDEPEYDAGPPPPPPPSTQRLNRVILKGSDGSEVIYPFTYDIVARRLNFDLPADKLTAGRVYSLTFVRHDGYRVIRELLQPIHFRVSRYSRFRDKIAAINALDQPDLPARQTGKLTLRLPREVYFGPTELSGNGTQEPAIRLLARIDGQYRQEVDRRLYHRLPMRSGKPGCGSIHYRNRHEVEHLEEAVVVSLGRTAADLLVTSEHLASPPTPGDGQQMLQYNVEYTANQHRRIINDQVDGCRAAEDDERHGEPGGSRIQDLTPIASLPQLRAGRHPVRVSYCLPDGRISTTADLHLIKH